VGLIAKQSAAAGAQGRKDAEARLRHRRTIGKVEHRIEHKGRESALELGLEAAYNRTALIIKFGPIVSWMFSLSFYILSTLSLPHSSLYTASV
jgi:hypothetical protein